MNFAQALRREKIRNLSSREAPLIISQTLPLGELIHRLQETKRGCAVVLKKKKVIGIFTEQDALKRGLLAGADPATPLKKLMTPNPAVLQMNDSLADAIRLMHEGKYRHLPIVDPQGVYLGLVSVRDIVFYLSENYPYEVLNQPPDPHQVSATAEGA
jgi:CBS domain-containing protein